MGSKQHGRSLMNSPLRRNTHMFACLICVSGCAVTVKEHASLNWRIQQPAQRFDRRAKTETYTMKTKETRTTLTAPCNCGKGAARRNRHPQASEIGQDIRIQGTLALRSWVSAESEAVPRRHASDRTHAAVNRI
eukprot:761999-Pleurochrysis_carterae.AAC.2